MQLLRVPGTPATYIDPTTVACVRVDPGLHGDDGGHHTGLVVHTSAGFAVATFLADDADTDLAVASFVSELRSATSIDHRGVGG